MSEEINCPDMLKINFKMKNIWIPLTLLSLLASCSSTQAVQKQEIKNTPYRPRVINTTDLGADPDDEQSMVRQLVSANEFDIEGLIVATGCWKKTQSNTEMLDKLIDAYEEAYPNLIVHADGYPTPKYLKTIPE